MDADIVLRLENIDKSFSSVKVLEGVSLSLRRGSVLGLVGENGAGKSTLMNILGGVVQKDSGEMFYGGKKYAPREPMDATRAGIAFIHQELNLFTNLSVMENIFIEAFPKKSFLRILDTSLMKKTASRILEQLGENISVSSTVGDLPMGCRQMVEIAKALHVDGKVIIFDEPTTSLSNKEKDKLFQVIRSLKERGVSVIYISHIIDDVHTLCDQVMVLRDGKVIGTDAVGNLTKEQIIHMMVGRELTRLFPYVEKKPGAPFLEVANLCRENVLRDVSFQLRKGEIVGLFGLMGAGRSELARAVFGVDAFDSGHVTIGGQRVESLSPVSSIEKGVSFITENRREEGLIMSKTVRDNLVLVYLKRLGGKLMSVNKAEEERASERAITDVKIKTYDKNTQAVASLSGGNQQKVVIGKWLLMEPQVFILDEPTRGVDVGAKLEIYNYVNALALRGSAILFISSEMEELMGVCDRILVMTQGEIAVDLPRADFDQERLMKYAVGGKGCYDN